MTSAQELDTRRLSFADFDAADRKAEARELLERIVWRRAGLPVGVRYPEAWCKSGHGTKRKRAAA